MRQSLSFYLRFRTFGPEDTGHLYCSFPHTHCISGPEREPFTVKFQERATVIDGKGMVTEQKYTVYGKEGENIWTLYPDAANGATVRQWPDKICVKWQGQVRVWRFEPRWQEGVGEAPAYHREYQTSVYQ